MKQLNEEQLCIEWQLAAEHESNSTLCDAVNAFISMSAEYIPQRHLKSTWLESPLGPVLAIADEERLYLLEFVARRCLEREINGLKIKLKATITPGTTAVTRLIGAELHAYFAGSLKQFTTPIHLLGSTFQQSVWQELLLIPYGETRSYAKQAENLGKPTAFRAVANANGANQLAIIIPCHRIINLNGALGGYGGGISRKQWLLAHEQCYK